MTAYELIAIKRDGGEHSDEEIRWLIRSAQDGSLPDYQAAAWLMAVFLRGMTPAETVSLTLAMRDSGRVLSLDQLPGIPVDKHSTGGVGDKTTLVVVPILAAAGIPVLKMSGRGLGFSGGTIDKLESIPGLRTDLGVEEALSQVARIGAAIVGQSPELVPADKALYALRDVTATVESIPLIAASIMSKKLAGGAKAILLDVKVGRGAFMKDIARARELAKTMIAIGKSAGVPTEALLTDMEEPLGRAVGNALEVEEAARTLTHPDEADPRFRALCLALAARGLLLGGKTDDSQADALAAQILESGAAARKLEEIIAAQGGDARVVQNPEILPGAPIQKDVTASIGGFVEAVDAEAVGRLAVKLGAGRMRKEDAIDPAAGVVLHRKSGEWAHAGESLATLHLSDPARLPGMEEELRAAFLIGRYAPPPSPVVHEMLEASKI